ncbi:hypothetical protein Sjap_017384 [Stephania japonica]|uniref:Uncharacterized protein n=1 Tax=Stephania japonica TaxID=461633 RepID=A0AAP0I631_9MAGN
MASRLASRSMSFLSITRPSSSPLRSSSPPFPRLRPPPPPSAPRPRRPTLPSATRRIGILGCTQSLLPLGAASRLAFDLRAFSDLSRGWIAEDG